MGRKGVLEDRLLTDLKIPASAHAVRNWTGWTLDSRSVSARLGDYSRVFPSQRIKVPSAQFADVTRKSIGGGLTADWSGRSSPVTRRRISRIVRPGKERDRKSTRLNSSH